MAKGTGWHVAQKALGASAGRFTQRRARQRALKAGLATPILRGRKIMPDAQAAIDNFLEARDGRRN